MSQLPINGQRIDLKVDGAALDSYTQGRPIQAGFRVGDNLLLITTRSVLIYDLTKIEGLELGNGNSPSKDWHPMDVTIPAVAVATVGNVPIDSADAIPKRKPGRPPKVVK